MKSPIELGQNRTGVDMSPRDMKAAVEGARKGVPHAVFDLAAIDAIRTAYSKDAEPFGTVAPPASVKGMAKSGMQKVMGKSPTVFIDMMADRLAFERTGTRLYEALLVKYDAAHVYEGGPTREEIEHIHGDELEHFGLLVDCMRQMGADPTSVTPTADVEGVAAMGAMQVITDPRSTLTECLHVIHMLELLDNDAWDMLADLAENLGQSEMAQKFRKAFEDEQTHLESVRTWLKHTIDGQAGIG